MLTTAKSNEIQRTHFIKTFIKYSVQPWLNKNLFQTRPETFSH